MAGARRLRRMGMAVALFALAGAACVPNLTAVQATGATGAKLEGRRTTFLVSGAVCRETAALSASAPTSCAAAEAEALRWQKVASALAAYGAKLAELASNEATPAGDRIAVALGTASKAGWIDLTDEQVADGGKLAKLVASLLTKTYREVELRNVIHDADPLIQRVTKALHLYLERQRDNIVGLEGAATSTSTFVGAAASHLDAGPEASAQAAIDKVLLQNAAVTLLSFHTDLEAKKADLEELDKLVVGFAAAHATLERNRDRIDAKDLLSEVVEAVKTAGITK